MLTKFSKIFTIKTALILLCTGFLFFGLTAKVNAATRTWSGTTNANWNNSGNWDVLPSAGDDLVFPSSASNKSNTNDFVADTSFNSITFTGTGYTLAGNRITLAASGMTSNISGASNIISLPIKLGATTTILITNSNETLTINGIISDGGSAYGISKTGTGKLVLGGANTLTGGIIIKNGTLQGNNNAAFGPATSGITLGDDNGSANTLIYDIGSAHNNPILVASGSSGTHTIQRYGNSPIFSGLITLNNNLIISDLSYGAGFSITGGITGTGNITFASANAGGTTLSGSTPINNIGTITNSASGTGTNTITAPIGTNVTGIIENSGTSPLTISGANTYTGPITNSAGILNLSSANTYSTLTLGANSTTTLKHGVTNTITSLVSNGTSGHLAVINSDLSGSPATINKTSGVVSLNYASIKDSTATGGASWQAYTSNGNVDATGNTGWLFTPLSNATQITSFNFTSPAVTGTVDNTNHTVALTVPYGTSVTSLTPTIVLATGATISPTSGTVGNFTTPQTYTVTAQDGVTTQNYTVTVTIAPNASTQITSFNFTSPSVVGTVDNTAHTVALTVPYGTSVTSLTPTIVLATGATISPTSGTAENFTSPQTYTVTAQDGVTTQNYTVTVTVALNTIKTITTFTFPTSTNTSINETNHTIAVTVPYGTSVTALSPTITTTGASVSPASGVAENFTSPQTYTVTALDSSTQQYIVTVTVALNPAKAITAFTFPTNTNTSINESNHTIAVAVPYGTNVTALVATFTTTGNSVAVGATTQISGTTPNNFTSPVTYTVTAGDSSTQNYTVTVTVALNPAKAITAFTFPTSTNTSINESNHTIAVTVPYSTAVTALVPTITISGASISPNTGVAQNFINPVTYTVTALDNSTQDYVVTVTKSAPTAITLINHTAIGSTNGGAITTAAIDCTGANFISIVSTNFGVTKPTDSAGNNYTEALTKIEADDSRVTLWYIFNPTVTNSMTFSSAAGGSPGIAVSCFSNVSSGPDKMSSSQGGGTPFTSGNITPTNDNELIISGLSGYPSGITVTPNSPLIPIDSLPWNGGYGGTVATNDAYTVQTTKTSINPSWNIGTGSVAVVSASFYSAISPASLAITTTNLPEGFLNTAYGSTVSLYTNQLNAVGGVQPYVWNLTSGTLPAGLSVSSSGLISGTPTATASATSLTFTVTDFNNNTASVILPITIASTLFSGNAGTCTGSALNGTQGQAYVGCQLGASGGTVPYTFTQNTSTTYAPLPEGMSISSSGAITGSFIGGQGGYGTQFSIHDNLGAIATPSITFEIIGDNAFAKTIFPSNSIFYRRVDDLPVDTIPWGTVYSGSTIKPYFGSAPSGNIPNGIPMLQVPYNQPNVNVSTTLYQSYFTSGPFPSYAPVESTANTTGDRHVLLYQNAGGGNPSKLWEMWQGIYENGPWTDSNNALWPDTTSNAMLPQDYGSTDAAGLPVAPYLVTADEVIGTGTPTVPNGAVHHAIRYTVQHMQNNYVWPATAHAGTGSCTGGFENSDRMLMQSNPPTSCTGAWGPSGEIYRLKSNVATPACAATSPQAAIIIQGFRQYGIITADNGNSGGLIGTPDSRWNDSDLACLSQLRLGDFEPVNVSGVAVDVLTSYEALPLASSNKSITTFDFDGLTPAITGVVDNTAHTITLTVPFGTDVTTLVPTITHTGASISPLSGVAGNFTTPQTYRVTAADSSYQDYVVTVTISPNTAKSITAFTVPNQVGATTINQTNHTVSLIMPYGTTVTALVPTISISGSSVSPVSGVANDFSTPPTYTVTAANASTQPYIVTVTVAPIGTHIITASTGANGSITPSGSVSVNNGSDQAFTITANSGYHIDTVTADSVAVSATSPYTFTNVTDDHTISVTFFADTVSTPVPVVSHGGGGMIIGWNNLPIIPTGGFNVSINQNASTTSNRIVTLNFNAKSDIKKMAISLTGDFADASQENYSSTKQIDLCSKFGGLIKNPTCPNGKYTIYTKFYTASGVASPVATSSITLTNGVTNTTKYNFTRNLSLHATGADVKALQQFLNANGFVISKTGAGSPGKETTLFGTLTYKALVKFQKSLGWSGTGFFGPMTRDYIANH